MMGGIIVDPEPDQSPRFEVVRPLGAGATARVELVRLSEPFGPWPAGSELALKTLDPALAHEPAARAAFAAEAAAAARVSDPGLVRVVHRGEREGLPYLLLQYVPGPSLRELLDEHGPLPEPRLRALGAELARALALLHAADLAHGDVKPENVRLDGDGRAVLLDLGFARTARLDAGAPQAGSLAYLSPERARGAGASPAADVFALGVVLYELATGVHPFAPDGRERRAALRLTRASSHAHLARRTLEVRGADELLAAIDAARVAPPSRLAPTLSPFFDRCLAAALARAEGERPGADELHRRFLQGERGEWWRTRQDAARAEPEHERPVAGTLPLVGRERELGELTALHHAARAEGRAAVAWLVGPEGSGKWRLADAFAERLRVLDDPPLYLETRWSEADEARPAGTLLVCLERWLGLPRGAAPGEREGERLAALIGSARARALLQALDPNRPEATDRSIAAELASWLLALASERPLLVLLDDLHAAGAATLGALSTVLEALRGARVTFVLALREDAPAAEPERMARLVGRLERGGAAGGALYRRIELASLDEAAVSELVRTLFHESAPLVRLAQVLWERSRGNPGFLTEILRDLEARGHILPAAGDDGRYTLAIAPEELPQARSLDRLIRERLRALEPDERRWLERLSVVGGRIQLPYLERAFPSSPGEIDGVLARLVQKGWLVPAADRYRFERPALREALYRAIAPDRRRRLHLSAARGAEGAEGVQGDGADVATDLEQAFHTAFHLHAADEHGELLAIVRRILGPLQRRASAQRLSTLARWGLEALEHLPDLPEREAVRLELLEEAADAADRLGRREDQRVLLDHLAKFELDPEVRPGEGARLYLLHARYAAGTGQFGLARGWLKTAVALAQRARDRWLSSQALRRLAQVQAQIGEFGDARKLARRAQKQAVGENQEALAHLALAQVDVLEDRSEDALRGIGAALSALRRTDEPRAGVVAYAELLHGRVLRSAGLAERALGAVQRAVRMARRAGERRLEAEALARRGGLLLDLDRPDLARAELRDAQLLADEIEDRRGQVLSTLLLGLLEAEQESPGARASLERALELAREIAFYRAESLGLALRARLVRREGDLAAAERDSAQALELCERHGAELADRIVVVGTRALLLGELGRTGEAERVLAELDRRVKKSYRRIAALELRAAQKAYAARLLAAVSSPAGPVFPRRS